MERELRALAQTHLEHIQEVRWQDLRLAVVTHLESLEEPDTLLYPRISPRDVCQHILHNRPCPNWTDGVTCGATWHPEFVQILDDGKPKWIWMPRQTICRTHQRSQAMRHPQGPFSCTDPNCLRSHAPNWLYAELWAFRWYVQHEFNTGLGTGYTLNGDLIAVSYRTANLTLATIPYVDEAYYHQYRWHAPIPQPEAYGDMMVTATSRRANFNEQPRKGRATTPRRHTSPRRNTTPTRKCVIRVDDPRQTVPSTQRQPWLAPEPVGEDPWTRAEREHAEQQAARAREEDPWTRAEREHAEQARAQAKAPPPPAPYPVQEPQVTPPVTPSINPPRQHRIEQSPIHRAFETLRQTAGSTAHSIPASVQTPPPVPSPVDLAQVVPHDDPNPMECDQWFSVHTFSTSDSRHHSRSMVRKATDPVHPPDATDTQWIAVPPTGKQRLPTEQPALTRVHSFPAASLSCEFGHMGNNHSGSLNPTNARRSTLRSTSADSDGIRNIHSRCLLAEVLVAPTFALGTQFCPRAFCHRPCWPHHHFRTPSSLPLHRYQLDDAC